jgi:hypothetical protein
MIKLIGTRVWLFALAAILVAGTFGAFSSFAQGGFGYMCDAWEESCDDGSGIFGSGGGSGGGGSGNPGTPTCVTIPAGCMSFGCNGNPGHYTCSLSVQQQGATCTSGGACAVH